jgi:hypothetical protein
VTAYLARFKGSSREHTESDLRCYLTWCAGHNLDPLAAQRLHLELYIRWMQETRRFKPSTISRRFSVTAGFYRTCAIDGVLEHSPAEHIRRPAVPAESPTLGFTHPQFEALLTARLVPLPPAVGRAIDRAVADRARGPVLLNSRVSCSPAAMQLLLRHTWPGNATQLWQVLKQVVQHRRTGQIMPQDLPPER